MNIGHASFWILTLFALWDSLINGAEKAVIWAGALILEEDSLGSRDSSDANLHPADDATQRDDEMAAATTSKQSPSIHKQVQVERVENLSDISRLLKDPMTGTIWQSPVLQEYLSFPPNITFVLTLVYSRKCAGCRERVQQLEREVPQLWEQGQEIDTSLPPPVVLLLNIDNQDPTLTLTKQLEGFGLTHVPALLWMMRDTPGNTFVLEFAASEEPDELTAASILQTFQHIQTRLLLLSSQILFDLQTGVFTVTPNSFAVEHKANGSHANETLHTSSPMQSWFMVNGPRVFRFDEQIPPDFLNKSERNYGKWLWNQGDNSAGDGYLLLGQCRSIDAEESILFDAFDRLAAAWINRRDIAMITISDCQDVTLDDGKVYVWRIDPNAFMDDILDITWEGAERVISIHSSTLTSDVDLKNALVSATTPSLMWLDRERTAPIAFLSARKVHAVLVVNVHRASTTNEFSLSQEDEEQAEILQRFRQTCRDHQRNPLAEDIVCLVVPSTDVRTLTIFGVDIWTRIDLAESQPSSPNNPEPEILPVVFITDQRFGGTRRYYLDRTELERPDGLTKFWQDFWEGRLSPFPKSSQQSHTNKAGINIITASDFQENVLKRRGHSKSYGDAEEQLDQVQTLENNHHALVLFTSSMCGHCRRLMTLWNQFGRLVQEVGWSSFLTLYQMDVSIDEVLLDEKWNETIRWVPDLIYIPPDTDAQPIRYAEKDAAGDDIVGGVSSYMDLVEWFLHVATLGDDQILEMLTNVRNLLKQTKT